MTNEEVARAIVRLPHGFTAMGGSVPLDMLDRVESEPEAFVLLFSEQLRTEHLEGLADDPRDLGAAVTAMSLLLGACGPTGAAEAERIALDLLTERDRRRMNALNLLGAIGPNSTEYEVEATRAVLDEVSAITFAYQGVVKVFATQMNPLLLEPIKQRLTTDTDLAWTYVEYLDVIAPDDLVVSELMHQLYETTLDPALRARLQPRVDAYLDSLTPPRFGQHGYAWADQPNAKEYSPSPYYRFNSSGGGVNIVRFSPGAYQVRFAGLGGGGGNVQVTAYGGDSHTCKTGGWSGVGDVTITVYCFNAAGARADSRFTVLFHREGLDHPAEDSSSIAYLWAQSPSTASYQASPVYAFNDRGAVPTITRSSTGQYLVFIPGAAGIGGPQVTAYGGDATRCRVGSWGGSPSSGTTISVACYNAAGALADSRFTLSYAVGRVPGLRDDGDVNRGAYAWAHSPSATSEYPATDGYKHNSLSAGEGMTILRQSVGSYVVDIARDVPVGVADTVHVGAYGGTGHCKVAGWGRASSATQIYVRCFSATGALADQRFDVLYLTDSDW